MSLLDDIELIKNDYIEIADAIDVIAKYEKSYDKARIILQHYKYEEHLTCYHINDCFQVFDDDGLGNPILINKIIQSLRIYEQNRDFVDFIEDKTGDECFVLIGQIYNELKTLYWKKSELLNFYPINKLFSEDYLYTDNISNDLKIENERLKSELADAFEKIKELEVIITNHKTHPAIDKTHPCHASELILAIEAWEAKYLKNEYPHDGHTPSIAKILKNKGYENKRLIDRISAITNPNK